MQILEHLLKESPVISFSQTLLIVMSVMSVQNTEYRIIQNTEYNNVQLANKRLRRKLEYLTSTSATNGMCVIDHFIGLYT